MAAPEAVAPDLSPVPRDEWSFAFGWLSLGLFNALLVDALDVPAGGLWGVRFAHHAVDLGRHLAFGFFAAGLSYLSARFLTHTGSRRLLAWFLYFLGSVLAGHLLLQDDVAGMAQRNAELFHLPVGAMHGCFVVLFASTAPLSAWAYRALSGNFVNRSIALVFGLSLYVVNISFSPLDNSGIHFFMSVASAQLMAAALSGVAARVAAQTNSVRSLLRGAVWGVFLLWGLWAVGYPHGSAVLVEAARWPGALLVQELAWSRRSAHASAAPLRNPYFRNRRKHADVAPSHALDLPSDAIVVMLAIDGMRADVLGRDKYRSYVPTISSLAERGAFFTDARSPGAQTVVSLTSFSTSSYYSQQRWTKPTPAEELWPQDDDSTHLAEVLSKASIRTVCIPTMHWMQNSTGILRGFQESTLPKNIKHWFIGKGVSDKVIKMLKAHKKGPLFLFTHYLDSHAPYSAGGKEGSSRERYLRSLTFLDSEIARVIEAAKKMGISERLTLILTSDHGEAFGEHGSRYHATTVYEELIRIPLIIHGPQIAPRRIKKPVSLVDIAPTVLDLFQIPTPGQFMGQSLTPLLSGQRFEFSRPLAIDSRLKRGMIFPGGFKVIHNARMDTTEIYNLRRDPKELHNLFPLPHMDDELGLLHAFFDQHILRDKGYEPPYRK